MDESRDPQEVFAEEYAPMSEKELMKLAREFDDLVEPAQAALRDEFKKRGMELPKVVKAPPPSNYADMSNSRLLDIAKGYDALPDTNQAALRAEFASRGLEPPLVEGESGSDTQSEPAAQDDALLNDPISDFITVRTYRDLSAAYVARAYLEASDIPCVLRDENMIRANWFLSNAIGGARLQVPSAYAEAANEKLSQPIPASFEDGTDQEFVQPVCPKCGSLDVVEDDMDRRIKAASVPMFPFATATLSALPFTPNADWKCLHCGCRWIDDRQPEPAGAAPLR